MARHTSIIHPTSTRTRPCRSGRGRGARTWPTSARTSRTGQLAASAELMRRNLEALWKATANPDERHAVLFELWDECAEGEGPIGDAGQRARAEVIGWIRAKLPQDHPGAFTAAELQALD